MNSIDIHNCIEIKNKVRKFKTFKVIETTITDEEGHETQINCYFEEKKKNG